MPLDDDALNRALIAFGIGAMGSGNGWDKLQRAGAVGMNAYDQALAARELAKLQAAKLLEEQQQAQARELAMKRQQKLIEIFQQSQQPPGTVNPPSGGSGPKSIPQMLYDAGFLKEAEEAAKANNAVTGEDAYEKIAPKDYTPESLFKFAQTRKRADLVPRTKVEVTSGLAYDPYATQPGTVLAGPEADVIPDGKGGFIPNPAKLALRRAGATNVTVETGEKPFVADFGKQQSATFFKMRDSAAKAADALQSVNNIREAIGSGAWQGGGANARASIANYLKPLGFAVDDTKLANTQAFTSAAGQFLLQHAKDLGANPSNSDAARIEKIVGSADTDPGAMQKILDWQEQLYRKSIRQFNGAYDQVKKNPAVFNAWDLAVPEPAPYGGGQSGALNTPALRYDRNGNRVQ